MGSLGLLYACSLTPGAGRALQMCTRSLTRAQTLLLPYSPFAPDPGDLLEELGLYLAWGRMAGSAVTVAERQKHRGAVEPQFYCCRAENRGLAPLPCQGSFPAWLWHQQLFLTGVSSKVLPRPRFEGAASPSHHLNTTATSSLGHTNTHAAQSCLCHLSGINLE